MSKIWRNKVMQRKTSAGPVAVEHWKHSYFSKGRRHNKCRTMMYFQKVHTGVFGPTHFPSCFCHHAHFCRRNKHWCTESALFISSWYISVKMIKKSFEETQRQINESFQCSVVVWALFLILYLLRELRKMFCSLCFFWRFACEGNAKI